MDSHLSPYWDLSLLLRQQSRSKHCLHPALQRKHAWLPLCFARVHVSQDYARARPVHLLFWFLNLMQPLWEPLELLEMWVRNKHRSCFLKWPLQKWLTAKETVVASLQYLKHHGRRSAAGISHHAYYNILRKPRFKLGLRSHLAFIYIHKALIWLIHFQRPAVCTFFLHWRMCHLVGNHRVEMNV